MARKSKKRSLIQRHRRALMLFTIIAILLCAAAWKLGQSSIPVLQPAGPIAAGERRLLIISCLVMLVVVVPVFGLTFWIAWRYRETNTAGAKYDPEWDHSRTAETIWWLIPTAIIAVLATLTWFGSHAYDPYRPLPGKSLQVQVVALDWRWLFIYPNQGIASINELDIPAHTPVQFNITADAPMNSFWIPQLGGQIYAMPGMDTKLSLEADKIGSYYGSSANISGSGFASMNFQTKALTSRQFSNWVQHAKKQSPLTQATYKQLAKPSSDKTVTQYSTPASNLYDIIISKYMSMPMNMEGM